MNLRSKEAVKRFVRGFIAGGLAAVVEAIGAGITIRDTNDLKAMGFILSYAFITGGILAIDKLIRGEK